MTREDAIEILQGVIKKPNTKDGYLGQAIDMAIKALEQESILDKIREEIKQTSSRYVMSRERGYGGQVEWSDRLIKESEVLGILDEYDGNNKKN